MKTGQSPITRRADRINPIVMLDAPVNFNSCVTLNACRYKGLGEISQRVTQNM
jgi:hypothetical protein